MTDPGLPACERHTVFPSPKLVPKKTNAFNDPFGYGYRGGDFYNPETDLRTSSRNVANFGGTRRLFGLGFRGVRSAE